MPLKVIRTAGGFLIAPLHFSLDPQKNAAWAEREKERYRASGLPNWEGMFRREMEIDFSASAGALAYPEYHESIHCVTKLPLLRGVPLCLFMDFNVAPMVWGTAQIVHGWVNVLRTFALSPATIAKMCTEFRNLYPSHTAPLVIYGDATGTHRDHQTGQSDYDLIRIGMAGYNVPVEFKVPLANPEEKDRVNALNTKLAPPDGHAGIRIVKEDCPHLIRDFEQVVLDTRGKLAKTYDQRNPYSQLSHASDAIGYLVHREFPAAGFVIGPPSKPAKPLKYGRMIGEM